MEISYVHIQQWPRKLTTSRRSSPFDSTLGKTLDLLESELKHVGARSAVVQVAMPEGGTFKNGKYYTRTQIRLDGRPYADAAGMPLSHPGVIVTFDKSKQPHSFPCDAFTDWQSNLRGVALALEALRKIDRYGVTSNAEQYRGWAQLPPPAPNVDVVAKAASDLSLLSVGNTTNAERIRTVADAFSLAYRLAAKAWHPDANGGQQLGQWQTLQMAAAVLSKHHRVA